MPSPRVYRGYRFSLPCRPLGVLLCGDFPAGVFRNGGAPAWKLNARRDSGTRDPAEFPDEVTRRDSGTRDPAEFPAGSSNNVEPDEPLDASKSLAPLRDEFIVDHYRDRDCPIN